MHVDTGRWVDTKREDRLCQVCHSCEDVENEQHFLLLPARAGGQTRLCMQSKLHFLQLPLAGNSELASLLHSRLAQPVWAGVKLCTGCES